MCGLLRPRGERRASNISHARGESAALGDCAGESAKSTFMKMKANHKLIVVAVGGVNLALAQWALSYGSVLICS